MAPSSKFGPKEAKLAAYSAPFVLLALLVVLVMVNVKHSMLCAQSGESAAEAALKRQALDKRLLALEQETLQNNVLFEKLIRRLDEEYGLTSGLALGDIKNEAHMTALSISARLAEEAAPPMPSFSELFDDPSKLNDAIDTAMEAYDDYEYHIEQENREEHEEYHQEMRLADDGIEADGALEQMESPFDDASRGGADASLSWEESRSKCLEWKAGYDVQPGMSWGGLPLDLQAKWRQYDCDRYTTGGLF